MGWRLVQMSWMFSNPIKYNWVISPDVEAMLAEGDHPEQKLARIKKFKAIIECCESKQLGLGVIVQSMEARAFAMAWRWFNSMPLEDDDDDDDRRGGSHEAGAGKI
jgi:hypothetical protein